MQIAEDLHDLLLGAFVQVAGWLVGQEHLGLVDQRPGDDDSLLLPGGQLAGIGPQFFR